MFVIMEPFPKSGMKTFRHGKLALKGEQYPSSFSPDGFTHMTRRLVANPIVLSFKQILQDFEQITAPVTFVCAGNRRKEQNIVRKTKGFSWGPAGLSTALWTGPMMADIIRKAKPLRKARYVCMEGADKLVSLWRILRIFDIC